MTANVRYEGTRFADDQNTLALAPATTVDARISYRLWNGLPAYVAGDNLLQCAGRDDRERRSRADRELCSPADLAHRNFLDGMTRASRWTRAIVGALSRQGPA